jgi:lipopolysaccharide biosynthesis glycosyltransferase
MNSIRYANNILIPIFFAFDNNYTIPAGVSFYSLLSKSNKTYRYKLIVLHQDITDNNKKLLIKTISPFENAELEFRNMKNVFNKEWDEISEKGHYTKECLYKLIPMIEFPEYDRIIWSDVDVLFKDDISDIYFMLDNANYIAGVRGCGKLDEYYDNMTMPDDIKNVLRNGIGAGILVYNLKKMRIDNVYNEVLRVLDKYKNIVVQPEQDVLNIVFKHKIDYLPLRYCFCTYMYNLYKDKHKMNLKIRGNLINYFFRRYKKNLKYDRVYSESELSQAFLNPAIIHYATSTKPWNTRFTKRKTDWLFCLFKTPFVKRYFLSGKNL